MDYPQASVENTKDFPKHKKKNTDAAWGRFFFFLSSQVIFKSRPVWKTMDLFVGKVNTAKINKFLP